MILQPYYQKLTYHIAHIALWTNTMTKRSIGANATIELIDQVTTIIVKNLTDIHPDWNEHIDHATLQDTFEAVAFNIVKLINDNNHEHKYYLKTDGNKYWRECYCGHKTKLTKYKIQP